MLFVYQVVYRCHSIKIGVKAKFTRQKVHAQPKRHISNSTSIYFYILSFCCLLYARRCGRIYWKIEQLSMVASLGRKLISSFMWARQGGLKGYTYVLTLGIASFRPISKEVPKKGGRTIDLSSYHNYPGVIILITPGKCIQLNFLL